MVRHRLQGQRTGGAVAETEDRQARHRMGDAYRAIYERGVQGNQIIYVKYVFNFLLYDLLFTCTFIYITGHVGEEQGESREEEDDESTGDDWILDPSHEERKFYVYMNSGSGFFYQTIEMCFCRF